jgi:hypothetical protein
MAFPRVLPNVDQALMSGRSSEPSKSRISRSASSHSGRTVAFDDLTKAPDPELGGADLRAKVADETGHPVVGSHGQNDVASLDAPIDDLKKWIPGAFAPYVFRGCVVPTGRRPSCVAVVTLDRRDE